jgi:hypothetical protein
MRRRLLPGFGACSGQFASTFLTVFIIYPAILFDWTVSGIRKISVKIAGISQRFPLNLFGFRSGSVNHVLQLGFTPAFRPRVNSAGQGEVVPESLKPPAATADQQQKSHRQELTAR